MPQSISRSRFLVNSRACVFIARYTLSIFEARSTVWFDDEILAQIREAVLFGAAPEHFGTRQPVDASRQRPAHSRDPGPHRIRKAPRALSLSIQFGQDQPLRRRRLLDRHQRGARARSLARSHAPAAHSRPWLRRQLFPLRLQNLRTRRPRPRYG